MMLEPARWSVSELPLFALTAIGTHLVESSSQTLRQACHAQETKLVRFAWFGRKQQLHFVHHVHADSNFAVIDFFWDRLLGTYRLPDGDTS